MLLTVSASEAAAPGAADAGTDAVDADAPTTEPLLGLTH